MSLAAIPTDAQGLMLRMITNGAQAEDLLLKLYINDVIPADRDTAAGYQEARGFGYEPKALEGGTWSLIKGPPVALKYPQQVFTFTGPLGRVYGYFVVQSLSDVLLWAERFADGPHQIVYSETKLKLTPRLEMCLRSEAA